MVKPIKTGYRVLGGILALLGIIIAFTPLLSSIPGFSVLTRIQSMIIGIALIVIGAFFLLKKTKKGLIEVPIYKGEQIVGYRRH